MKETIKAALAWVRQTLLSPSLVGVVVGSALALFASERTYSKQHQTEMRERSYSKLFGIEIA